MVSQLSNSRPVRLYRVPMVSVAIALSVGIVLGRYLSLPTGFWAVVGGVALVAAGVTFFKAHLHLLTSIMVGLAIVSAGAVHCRLAYFHIAEDHIVTYAPDRSRILSAIRGRVVTAPKTFDVGAGVRAGYRRGLETSLLIETSHLRTCDGWKPVCGLVKVNVKEKDTRLAAGQDVELLGRLGRFDSPDNPGQYDFSAAMRNKHCLAGFTVEGADGVTILAGADPRWYERVFWRLRAGVRQHLTMCGDERGGQLLNALLVGERDESLRTLNRAMVRSGVAHFLSISGLHLGVFLGFIFLLCRMAMLTLRRSAVIVLVILATYMLLAEPRAPLLRAAIMATALCLSLIFGRRYSSLNSLAIAAVVLLGCDPLQLFSAAFQLSFVIVAGLFLFYAPVEEFLFGSWKRRRGLIVFRDEHRVRRWFYFTAANWLIRGVSLALAAYLVATPLVAYHFGLFCPYAPVLSLLLFPLVLVILIPGYVSMALAWPMPNLSHRIGSFASLSADAMASVVESFQHLPGMSFELSPIGPFGAALCYLAMLAVLFRRRWRFGWVWAGGSVLAAVAFVTWTQLPAPAPKTAQLHLLAVGPGQCALLRTPAGKRVLIDAGTQGGYDAYERVLGPFLREKRFPHPDIAFITHANSDHYNALGPFLNRRRLRTVYLNEYFGRPVGDKQPPEAEQYIMKTLEDSCDRIIRLKPGYKSINLDERTRIEVLWPPAGRSDLTVNDTSLVLRITCDGRSVLITGDIDVVAQRELATLGDAIRADVLVLPHHGAWRKTLPPFVKAVNPKIVLVSSRITPSTRAGKTNTAAQKFFANLKSTTRLYTTARNGWTCLTLDENLTVETMKSK